MAPAQTGRSVDRNVVGIGELVVAPIHAGSIVTHALGSCIAVVLYDAAAGVGGLLHFQLPDSAMDQSRAQREPGLFGDTGVALLIATAERLGALRRRCRVHLVGGAQMVRSIVSADIGRRNHQSARRALWRLGVLVAGEDVGGDSSRTVEIELARGAVWVRSASGEAKLT